jgi:hypothetical protein
MMSDGTDLSVELGEDVAKHRCVCCNRESVTVHGYLYDETGDTTVYLAGYVHGHPERRANLVLSVGGWGEGTGPDDRKAIALQLLAYDGRCDVLFPPAETSPWFEKETLGRMVQPGDMTEDERSVYTRLANAAADKDPRIADYLANG